ncbi:hypothetical protein K491DRAFT_711647 [Lophiostoma macrostomum CBS 122681]|uniref:Asteroid domain-containing protein n=1 Tax=Lophiostoma macrostomum CBS 122681 TaxID=1314788 RepID=A0A6A6TM75_9PLEO|nr:hypothetical protein K491DRAFT_711647 [Lophiostoma macrostomum CBS 122681]
MGIPGLLSHLEPYAVQYTSADLEGYSAIIDGPALAYHAQRVSAEIKSSHLPSYEDINAVAIRWLKSLEDMNIKVSAILFDGVLPTSKRDERSARLQQSVKRVTQLRSMFTTTGCPVPKPLGSVLYPFLAPAVKEALRETDFASVTRLVPGEADDWCASYAKDRPRSIIFTGDTDLILYEYPPEVLVAFFKDLDILPKPEIKVHSPFRIGQQLKLSSVVHLAFAVYLDRWKPFMENVREARKINIKSAEYHRFSGRYLSKVQSPPYLSKQSFVAATLDMLDVRTSEFVHQVLSISATAGLDSPLCLTVFLPVLFEDPLQASAWNSGQNIRILAYSVFTLDRLVIQEHKRKAQNVTAQAYTTLTHEELILRASNLAVVLEAARSTAITTPVQYWITVALKLHVLASQPPHVSLATRGANGDFDNTWAYVHLNACIQAILYSLRVLKQCISVRLAMDRDKLTSSSIEILTRLHESLHTFPAIAEIFTIPGQPKRICPNDVTSLEAVKSVYVSTGIDDRELFEEPKSKRQRKRDKRKRKADNPADVGTSQTYSDNAFALLDADNAS